MSTERLFTRAFALCCLANFGQALAFNLFLHFPGFLHDLGAGEVTIGVLFGLTAVTAVVMRAPIGPLIDARGHTLSISLPAEPVYVMADFARLSQVISNLLNNAANYTEPGGRITLVASADDVNVTVSVTDTGIGIAADMLGPVFGLFAQVDESLERVHGGLGVGLTLARHLVELHHGSIEARSEGIGKGSEFIVRVPRAHVRADAHAA